MSAEIFILVILMYNITDVLNDVDDVRIFHIVDKDGENIESCSLCQSKHQRAK
jgi:hypothetical protein